MHRNPFTDDDDCGNMDLLQAQHQAEEIFDYSTNEDIMATLKKETKATPAKSAPAKAPAPAAKAHILAARCLYWPGAWPLL